MEIESFEVINDVEPKKGLFDEEFSEIVSKKDPIDFFKSFLFPTIVGEQYDLIRKAVLLMLATQYDKKKRTRIHILLVGEPGSGKTDILLWIKNKIGAYFVNAEYASKVGLSGDARGREISPGIIADADGSILAIDELDKMSYKDQSALLQAMEEGKYIIVKGGMREAFRAEIRVIATANDITKIQKPLLDRFDFIFNIKIPSKKERLECIPYLVDSFFNAEDTEQKLAVILREYIRWINSFEPVVENIEEISDELRKYVESLPEDVLNTKSYRSLEFSILRIAYVIAKIRKKNIDRSVIADAIRVKSMGGE